MPKLFAGENARLARDVLWITIPRVQFSHPDLLLPGTYQALFYIASTAILIPMFFSAGMP